MGAKIRLRMQKEYRFKRDDDGCLSEEPDGLIHGSMSARKCMYQGWLHTRKPLQVRVSLTLWEECIDKLSLGLSTIWVRKPRSRKPWKSAKN